MPVIVDRAHPACIVVTLNRPDVRNAMGVDMVERLHEICGELERDPRILVITGAGSSFASGVDLRELHERGTNDALNGISSGLFDRIAALPLPTIAAVNGPAYGGGAELAYACDFRIGTSRAVFANPEVQLGVMPAAGACWRLGLLVGEAVGRQMLLACRTLDAEAALSLNLLSEIVPQERLMPAALELADQISKGSPLALRLTKLAIAAPPAAHPSFDNVAQAVLFETADKRRRITRFLERNGSRRPQLADRAASRETA